jgi:hypothetical protein
VRRALANLALAGVLFASVPRSAAAEGAPAWLEAESTAIATLRRQLRRRGFELDVTAGPVLTMPPGQASLLDFGPDDASALLDGPRGTAVARLEVVAPVVAGFLARKPLKARWSGHWLRRRVAGRPTLLTATPSRLILKSMLNNYALNRGPEAPERAALEEAAWGR